MVDVDVNEHVSTVHILLELLVSVVYCCICLCRITKESLYSWLSRTPASLFFRTSPKSTLSRGQKFASYVSSARNS